MSEVVRGELHWAHEGRKALWVQRLKHENRMDETVIFGLERVALMWVLKEERKTRKEMALPSRHSVS